MPDIVLIRDKKIFDGTDVIFDVVLDGTREGTVKNGETIRLSTYSGGHTIQLVYDHESWGGRNSGPSRSTGQSKVVQFETTHDQATIIKCGFTSGGIFSNGSIFITVR